MKRSDYPMVHGVGINDADYSVRPLLDGKRVQCQAYTKWERMLFRCYGDKGILNRPTYDGCSVCDEWLIFSNFKAWMDKQDWYGKNLDKDIIIIGNKVYSPETCAFVDGKTNLFVTDRKAKRGESLIGTSYRKSCGKYAANCGNPITGSNEYLGIFNSEVEAHEAWRVRKNEIAIQLAAMQSDKRVSEALLNRYTKATIGE